MATKLNKEESDLIDSLIYVKRSNGRYGGWKFDILTKRINVETEKMMVTCTVCMGLSRDPNLIQVSGMQQIMCSMCVPSGVGILAAAQMNRFLINQKHANCPYNLKGCTWTDIISNIRQHLGKCIFFPVKCPLGCASRVERSKLTEHIENCPVSFIPCPNSCRDYSGTRKLKRIYVAVHMAEECPEQELDCPYLEFGCTKPVKRSMMGIHEKEQIHKHFKLSMDGLKTSLNKQVSRISDLQKENEMLKSNFEKAISIINQSKGILEMKIEGVKNKICMGEKSESDPFYVGLYKCQVHIQWNCGDKVYVGCFISILQGNSDNVLTWPFKHRATVVLINLLNNCDNYSLTHEVTDSLLRQFPDSFQRPREQTNQATGMTTYVSHAEILKEKYTSMDTVSLKIIVERM